MQLGWTSICVSAAMAGGTREPTSSIPAIQLVHGWGAINYLGVAHVLPGIGVYDVAVVLVRVRIRP